MRTGATAKLEDTRTLLDQLNQAGDAILFKALFNSFLNSARAITYALQKDFHDAPEFKDWYTIKQGEMTNCSGLFTMPAQRIFTKEHIH